MHSAVIAYVANENKAQLMKGVQTRMVEDAAPALRFCTRLGYVAAPLLRQEDTVDRQF